MTEQNEWPPAVAAITDDLVETLGSMAGLRFPRERLPLIAQRLRDLDTMAAELDAVDLEDAEPAIRFDPAWPKGGAA